jgi:hypothetical protein
MAAIAGRLRMTGAESFWYVLGCIAFGGMYFAKIPTKKALSEAGFVQLTGAEQFWYVLQCIAFGAGYFAKVPVKKALTEITHVPASGQASWSVPGTAPSLAGDYGSQASIAGEPGQSAAAPESQRRARHAEPREHG